MAGYPDAAWLRSCRISALRLGAIDSTIGALQTLCAMACRSQCVRCCSRFRLLAQLLLMPCPDLAGIDALSDGRVPIVPRSQCSSLQLGSHVHLLHNRNNVL